MRIRRDVRGLLWIGTAATLGLSIGLLVYCSWVGTRSVHLAVLAVLTTSGPLLARIFEGLVRRRQRTAGLEMNCLEADDEILISRTVPLALPILGAAWAFSVML